MAEWVRLCGVAEAPAPGEVMEAEANGVAVCLANVDGRLSALDNVCPHRQGPLGQGWLEGQGVVCPRPRRRSGPRWPFFRWRSRVGMCSCSSPARFR
jgi:nitrite reductase/ring-hydroxylating ferredoxin subunit